MSCLRTLTIRAGFSVKVRVRVGVSVKVRVKVRLVCHLSRSDAAVSSTERINKFSVVTWSVGRFAVTVGGSVVTRSVGAASFAVALSVGEWTSVVTARVVAALAATCFGVDLLELALGLGLVLVLGVRFRFGLSVL